MWPFKRGSFYNRIIVPTAPTTLNTQSVLKKTSILQIILGLELTLLEFLGVIKPPLHLNTVLAILLGITNLLSGLVGLLARNQRERKNSTLAWYSAIVAILIGYSVVLLNYVEIFEIVAWSKESWKATWRQCIYSAVIGNSALLSIVNGSYHVLILWAVFTLNI